MAKLVTECGVNVFIDATANKRKYRNAARKLIPQFGEVYIHCPLRVCMDREAHRRAASHQEVSMISQNGREPMSLVSMLLTRNPSINCYY